MENYTAKFWGDWGQNIQRKRPDKRRNNSWAQHHENAPAHVSLIVQQFLASTKTTVILHPPYSPVLATRDFVLFPKTVSKLKGWSFDSTEEIQTKSQEVMMTPTQNDFQQCFQSWKSCWDLCINVEGGYFEGDGGE